MSGTTAPTTAPIISAELPAPRKETNRPANDPMPAPTTAIMSRFDMRERGGSSGRPLQHAGSLAVLLDLGLHQPHALHETPFQTGYLLPEFLARDRPVWLIHAPNCSAVRAEREYNS